jgi:hypothetical protein
MKQCINICKTYFPETELIQYPDACKTYFPETEKIQLRDAR